MKQAFVVWLALILCVSAAAPAVKDDPAAPVRQFIDGFNTNKVESAFAAYATSGSITIGDACSLRVFVVSFGPFVGGVRPGPDVRREFVHDGD